MPKHKDQWYGCCPDGREWALLYLESRDPPYALAQWEPRKGEWVTLSGDIFPEGPLWHPLPKGFDRPKGELYWERCVAYFVED